MKIPERIRAVSIVRLEPVKSSADAREGQDQDQDETRQNKNVAETTP